MRIGLVGMPGAGKTDVAWALHDYFTDDMVDAIVGGEKPTEHDCAHIIDRYIDKFSERTDIALGHFAGYTTNLQAAFKRVEREQEALAQYGENDIYITCGTHIETLLYNGLHSAVVQNLATVEERQIEWLRMETSAKTMSMLMWDTWRYDYTFYLPLQSVEDPTAWDAIADGEATTALESFFIEYVALAGSTDERARWAYDYIQRAEAAKADERPVRSAERAIAGDSPQ